MFKVKNIMPAVVFERYMHYPYNKHEEDTKSRSDRYVVIFQMQNYLRFYYLTIAILHYPSTILKKQC